MGVSENLKPLFDSIAFATRAHRNQLRKDGQTPYVAHPFRVCLIVRHVFGVDDARVLTAAVLHDTIEDTTTDRDDIDELFGPEVGSWVAALSKDMRLPEAEREPQFIRDFCAGGWPVHIVKLADLYDNIQDSSQFPADQRRSSLSKWRTYIDGLEKHITPESKHAFDIVKRLFDETWNRVAGKNAEGRT